MKNAVTKVIDTLLIQEDFHGAFQKLLERYNKCIAAEWDYFEGDQSFICVQLIKVPIRKKSVGWQSGSLKRCIINDSISGTDRRIVQYTRPLFLLGLHREKNLVKMLQKIMGAIQFSEVEPKCVYLTHLSTRNSLTFWHSSAMHRSSWPRKNYIQISLGHSSSYGMLQNLLE